MPVNHTCCFSGWLRLAVLSAAVLLLTLGPATVSAEDRGPGAEEAARKLQEVYDEVTGFKAEFTQVTSVPMSRRQREGAGTVTFSKPHQMRWEYESPDHQVLVGDGKEVMLYFADSNQMMISDVDAYLDSDVTYAFFSGTGDILRDFRVTAAPADERSNLPADGAHALRLEPREPHPQVDYLDLLVGGEPFFIRRLDIVDHFGSITTLRFSNIQLDPDLPDDFNHFEPPPDTEILRDTPGLSHP